MNIVVELVNYGKDSRLNQNTIMCERNVQYNAQLGVLFITDMQKMNEKQNLV